MFIYAKLFFYKNMTCIRKRILEEKSSLVLCLPTSVWLLSQ